MPAPYRYDLRVQFDHHMNPGCLTKNAHAITKMIFQGLHQRLTELVVVRSHLADMASQMSGFNKFGQDPLFECRKLVRCEANPCGHAQLLRLSK